MAITFHKYRVLSSQSNRAWVNPSRASKRVMKRSSLCVPSSLRVALVRRNRVPSSTIDRVWFPFAVSRRTNSLASESAARVRAPRPGIRPPPPGDVGLTSPVGEVPPVNMEYPPAPTARTILTIVIHALDPKLGSDPSGGSGIISFQATTPIRMNPAAPKE